MATAIAWLGSALSFGQAQFSVFGTVEDATGTPIPNAIAFLTSELVPSTRYIVHTDGVGRYRFAGLTPGAYRLELHAPGFITVTVPIQVSSGTPAIPARTVLELVPNAGCSNDVYPRDIRLLSIGSARGALAGLLRLRESAASIRVGNRKMRVVVLRAGREVARVATDRSTFRVADLNPGKYSVQITGTGIYADAWDVTVREDLETEYEFPVSRCRDRACDPAQRYRGEPVVLCQ